MGQKNVNSSQARLPIPADKIYCPDANALIDLYHAGLIKKLRPFIINGTVRIPEGVYRELKRKTDKLKRTLDKWNSNYNAVVNLASHEKLEFSRIETSYKNDFRVGTKTCAGLWRTPSGRKGIDSQVISFGKVRGWVVVSHDSSVKGACAIENVECITWEEFGRRMRIIH